MHPSTARAIAGNLLRIRRHGGWLVLAIAALWLVRRYVPVEPLRSATDVGGNFLQAFVGIYGLVLAFAIFVTWTQQNETQVAIEREANLVAELYRLLSWFDRWPQRDSARKLLRDYARNVPRAHAEDAAADALPERELLEQLFSSFLGQREPSAAEEHLWEKALDLAHDLSIAREERITRAGLRLPDGLKWFVVLGAAASVAILIVLHVEAFWVHALFVAVLTWAVVAAVTIVIDLDDPYTGDFVVDWTRFDQAIERVDGAAEPQRVEARNARTGS